MSANDIETVTDKIFVLADIHIILEIQDKIIENIDNFDIYKQNNPNND